MKFLEGFKEALCIEISWEDFGYFCGGMLCIVGLIFAFVCFLYTIKEILDILRYYVN